ncbi:hypothetical protein IC744_08690 [Microbacterium hominis]|uniref:O-antigen ligase family protein n=1 Tax=Microbacterium TaxID=33882 RepID=UPI00168AD4B6|nr:MULTISPECIES: O-antigen ligase family protein [Microbacterium]QOC26399.1 hypothetical protein IC745_03030 [Microbacterium hominis]QOC27582.1 hypothetical protein IC744_08690 [Microbacterium hominis]QYF97293.1 hypothetical protein KY498_14220 [Microbacterium sp. PAMC21962]
MSATVPQLLTTPSPAAVQRAARDTRNARIIGLLFGIYAGTIGVRISVGGGLAFPTAVFLIGLVATLLCFAPQRLRHLRITWIDFAIVAYFLVRVLTEAINADRLDHSPAYPVAVNAAYYITAYYCARLTVSNRDELRAFLGALALPSIAVSAIGVLQVLGVSAVTSFVVNFTQSDAVINRLTDGRLTRASSLIGHWSALGGYLCCAAAIAAVCLVLDRAEGRRVSRTQLLVFAASMVGVLATFTFAAILAALAILIATMAVLGYKVRGLLALTLLFVAASVVFGDSLQSRFNLQDLPTTYLPPEFAWVPSTLAVRIYLWTTQTLPAISIEPWLGWGHSVFAGVGTWPVYPKTIVWPFPESEYIKTLITGGIAELSAQVLVFIGWLTVIRRGGGSIDVRARSVLTVTFASLLIASSINAYFTNQGVPSIWWPLVGALAFAYTPGSALPASRRTSTVTRTTSSAR